MVAISFGCMEHHLMRLGHRDERVLIKKGEINRCREAATERERGRERESKMIEINIVEL